MTFRNYWHCKFWDYCCWDQYSSHSLCCFFQFFCLFFFLLNFFSCCQKKVLHFSPNYDSILRWKIILLKDHLWWCSVYGSCFCSCHSVSYSLQFKRKCTGVSFTLQVEHSGEVSVSVLLFWPFSIDCPLFSLVILEIPFLEVFFRRVPLVLTSYEIC